MCLFACWLLCVCCFFTLVISCLCFLFVTIWLHLQTLFVFVSCCGTVLCLFLGLLLYCCLVLFCVFFSSSKGWWWWCCFGMVAWGLPTTQNTQTTKNTQNNHTFVRFVFCLALLVNVGVFWFPVGGRVCVVSGWMFLFTNNNTKP